MKFLSTILGNERDRLTRRRRALEMNLHRMEEKAFLLEMELEEVKRQRAKTMEELRQLIPTRLVSTISVSSSEDNSFDTDSEPADRYVRMPPQKTTNSSNNVKCIKKLDVIRQEEQERSEWIRKQKEKENKAETNPRQANQLLGVRMVDQVNASLEVQLIEGENMVLVVSRLPADLEFSRNQISNLTLLLLQY
ncbi:unnamed protein product [Caenorhabditis angaria]|uniref:Uncharacterized protein n=1 Tax=Caenorhabditis angaria TaxID=860376 RepID=A0A9P1MZP6_9PELO|nr:unnamed protein product [Caenorhabditis angaria]